MTRKDYELIAATFAEYREDCFEENKQVVNALARKFAVRLQQDNPRFDRARFLRACGLEV